jgi:ElaB/YqjD/DUF883 family membrane-anchored ribosome-binding protein
MIGKKSDATRDVVAQAAERASDAGRKLAELGSAIQERAQETLRTTGRTMRRSSRDYTNRLRDYVEDYPFAAIGIALAVGAVLSAIVLSGSRR